MITATTTIVLLRRDLRVFDNPALFHACQSGSVILLYVLDESNDNTSNKKPKLASDFDLAGGASKWWLHQSLQKLNTKIKSLGGELVIRRGDTEIELSKLAKLTGATNITWNRRYEPQNIISDKQLKSSLKEQGLQVTSYCANLLSEPWETLNQQQLPYKVFTAYWRNCRRSIQVPQPLPIPEKPDFHQLSEDVKKANLAINDLDLLDTKINWADSIDESWNVGEDAAQTAWDSFLESNVVRYKTNRDIPSVFGTSRLSPHICFGEISVRQLWHDLHNTHELDTQADVACYLSEIGWREFSYYLLYHFPHITHSNYNSKFDNFSWQSNQTHLTAWQKGQTGYPIIDAGMRELWHTGYMHNRVRMVVASFLCKHLLIHWHEGAKWFWDTLVDADLASNTASWQWVAGCGTDAAPYFRIFNPVTQGEKFDKKGLYTRKWVPELKELNDKYLHQPWNAPQEVLSNAGVKLGEDYPKPIVDHKEARILALDLYKELKQFV